VSGELADTAAQLAADWELELGEPYPSGGQTAWVAPAANAAGDALVLKVGRRHWEAEHEADGLRLWDGNGAVHCFKAQTLQHTTALLLERCEPGTQLKDTMPEAEQDVLVAGLLRRLWELDPPKDHVFESLTTMCGLWADELQAGLDHDHRGSDPGLARAGIELLRGLPNTADRNVLLSTDLHAGNILAAQRESWLAIDPKPFVGDPTYDPVQHMLNCQERLVGDPLAFARRMAGLLDLDAERLSMWLFARCAQESLADPSMRAPAAMLASSLT
jgi:streptomycin 6-kinase